MKLIFFGDSLIWGGYGGNLVAEVAALRPDHEIINAGQGGSTVLNLMERLDSILSLEPDGIFIMVGGNDAISYTQPATRPYYQQVQKIPDGIVTPEMFARTYRELLTTLQLAHVLTWVGLEPVEYSPEMVAAVHQYNALAKSAADSLYIPVFDLMARLTPAPIPARPPLTLADINLIGRRSTSGWSDFETARREGNYTYSFDGIHFTPQTARRVAEWIVEFIGLT
jgi:lysophospholipase L1-like esterase